MITALVSRPREIFTDVPVPPTSMRQPRPPFFLYKVAMHWDGTYRDRVRNTRSRPAYWFDDEKSCVAPARTFAKHLESREETDHRLGYLSDDELELLSDLQRRQI